MESLFNTHRMSEAALNPSRTALLLIDLQQGIVRLSTAPHAADTVLANAARLLAAARATGIRPTWVHVGGATDLSDRLFPSVDQPTPRRSPAPDYSDFVPEIAPQAEDVVILKRQWGAFYGTDLDLQLRRRGIDGLLLAGIATEFGVESTARDAYERGFRQWFASDAMTGLTAASHANAIECIFPRMGHVRNTEQIASLMEWA